MTFIYDSVKAALSNRSVIQICYISAIFLVWISTAFLVKRFFISKLLKWTGKTKSLWDDVIVQSINTPINFLIFGPGLVFAGFYINLSLEIQKILITIFQISIVLASVFFVNGVFKGFIDANVNLPILKKISAGAVKGLIRVFIFGIGVLIVLDMLGISITPILASLGIGSLAVALALQDTLSNFFAGIYMAIDKPIENGDFIKLEGGEQGYVVDIGWRSTRVRTLPNNVVIVPNAKLMSSVITNFYKPDTEIAVLVEVGVNYGSDLKHVERVVMEEGKKIMLSVPGGVLNFDPFIRFHTFGDSSINFTVILRAKEFVDNYFIKHEFIKALHERFKKENINIPYPIRTIEISNRQPEKFK